MPKKVGRNAGQRESLASSATAVCTPPASSKVKTNKRSHRSVHIGLRNGKRWVSLKKKLNLSTDDDLVVYLLDLADSFAEQGDKNCHNSSEPWKSECRQEKSIANSSESPEQEILQELPRRSLRKHTNLDESPKNEKSEKVEKVLPNPVDVEKSQHSKSLKTSKFKRHKSKGRHHKEKRKKRKHQKIKSIKDLDPTKKKVKNDDPWEFASESETEKASSEIQDNFISQTVSKLSKDLDCLESNKIEVLQKPIRNLNQEICLSIKKTDVSIDQTEDATYAQENVNLKMVQNHNTKAAEVQINIHEQDKFLESNQSKNSYSSKILSDQKNIENAQLDQENSSKKHKRSKHEIRESCNAIELNRSYCDEVVTSTHKKEKKKHKDHQVRKHRDVRKAPQDGIIVTDENQDTSCSANLISATVTATTVPNNDSQASEAMIENIGVETPRLAIKIKLCQECNSRHLEDACPLSEPVFTIRDSVTLDQWVEQHKKNSEVMKAFNSNDPISQGYGKSSEDGFESDEETSEQYKSKIKTESEEKQMNIEATRPLFARDSLPDCLELRMTNGDHGLGVFVKRLIPMYAQLGPLIGKPIQEMDIPDDFPMRHIWEIDINNKTSYISSTNPVISNWIRYIRPAETKEDRNVAVMSRNGELYLITSKSLNVGTELMYWSDSQSTAWTRKNKIDKTNCGGCNLNFSHPIYYRLHCCIFHDTNYSLTIRKYHCKVCGAAVLGKDNIMKHAAQLHAGRGAYQCQYCKKFFLRLNYLEMHRTYGCSQNPQRSRPLCDFCGRKFCQPQKLKVHIKRMHSDMSEVLREFQCKLCLKLLGSRAALQRHMKEVHHKDVVGAATCDRCGKMFQNKSNLKIHMLTHSGVKPFKCKENGCKAAFTTKQCLQFHYKKVHGLSEDLMPKIERSVAYTFDAYSGGLVEDAGRGKTPKFSNSDDTVNSNENSDSFNSFDDCSNENDQIPVVEAPGNSNGSSSKQLNIDEEPIQQMSMPAVIPESPVESCPESDVDLYETNQMSNKTTSGSKKWISEFDPPPAASTSPPVTSTADIYDFQERVTEMDVRREEDKIQSTNQNLIDDTKLGIGMYRRTESSNASLLVEAALDAAEREIGAVSSPNLEDSDREANLYSISNELDFKTACTQGQMIHRSPNGHLDSYMQEDLANSPAVTPHARHTPPGHMHLDYHIHRPVDYVNMSGVRTSHSIEQYLDQQDLQRVIHVPQDIPTSPTRYQEIPHHHHPHPLHHHHQHHQMVGDGLSSDEGDSVAQNLSLTVKEKSLQQIELSKYDGLESDFALINRDRVRFEPLIVQSSADQGLDMSARGLQQAFGSQNHHHHHHIYEMNERERQGVDLSRTSAACMSPPPSYPPPYPSPYSHVDVPRVVSLESSSRSHHLHTSVSRIIASPQPASSLASHIGPDSLDTRILSPPPPTMPSYNSTYPVGPAPYHTSRPGYHYSGYY